MAASTRPSRHSACGGSRSPAGSEAGAATSAGDDLHGRGRPGRSCPGAARPSPPRGRRGSSNGIRHQILERHPFELQPEDSGLRSRLNSNRSSTSAGQAVDFLREASGGTGPRWPDRRRRGRRGPRAIARMPASGVRRSCDTHASELTARRFEGSLPWRRASSRRPSMMSSSRASLDELLEGARRDPTARQRRRVAPTRRATLTSRACSPRPAGGPSRCADEHANRGRRAAEPPDRDAEIVAFEMNMAAGGVRTDHRGAVASVAATCGRKGRSR